MQRAEHLGRQEDEKMQMVMDTFGELKERFEIVELTSFVVVIVL